MYYSNSNIPVNGSRGHPIPVAGQENPGTVYLQAPAHYSGAAAGYPMAAQLPVAVPQQRLSTPQPQHQAYAIVSNPYGGMSPTTYSAIQAVPQANHGHTYLATTGQQYPSSYGYAAMGQRNVAPAAYQTAPLQAGAPLFAAGYSGIPSGATAMASQQANARSVPIGYQQAYALAQDIPYGAAAFGPPY